MKWVEVPYVLLFISLQDKPGLCPKGAHLGVKPSAPSCPLSLPLSQGLPTEQDPLPVGVASVLVEEKAMANHSSTLAWKIPGTEEPGRLQSMGSLRVRHD